MLERIGNISFEADFNKQKRRKYGSYKGSAYAGSSFDINDSISFSPASKYLSQANWLLKEYHQSNEGKIIVEFNYDGFCFEVSLDIETLSTINSLVYRISKDGVQNSLEKDISATFKISIGESSQKLPLQKELRGLEMLFNRFGTLNLNNELNIYNYELIDTLLEGMYQLLQNDFEYLNNTLLQFIEKQTNKNAGSLTAKFRNESTEISLQKIKPLSAI
ncbi:MAG: hypothetical protein L3J41_14430 [Melioribacteraceae bacterium]|nr:hypothetical protein [Melioribacteraceae bacterium]